MSEWMNEPRSEWYQSPCFPHHKLLSLAFKTSHSQVLTCLSRLLSPVLSHEFFTKAKLSSTLSLVMPLSIPLLTPFLLHHVPSPTSQPNPTLLMSPFLLQVLPVPISPTSSLNPHTCNSTHHLESFGNTNNAPPGSYLFTYSCITSPTRLLLVLTLAARL